jgi:DNA polymerase I-like protein with 3'-5' exonuclease and polymerase domains
MLVRNRDDFDCMLDAVRNANVMAFDSESTGLNVRHGDYPVGISIYTDRGESFYFAFDHGTKNVDDNYEQYKKMSVDKRLALAYRTYNESGLRKAADVENMPGSWLRELADVWLCPRILVAHNAQHDLTTLDALGFPLHPNIEDTMSMLSVCVSDWRGNAKEGYYPQFYMNDTKQYENGSRGLKWQSRLWRLEDATSGIGDLDDNVKQLNDKLKELSGGDAALRITKDVPAQAYLWMLKPSEVALYAESDTRLTYLLREKIYGWADKWNERHLLDLYNRITVLCWQMQHNGIRFDDAAARKMYEEGKAHLADIDDRIRASSNGMIENPASPAQVLTYLQAIGLKVTSTGKDVLDKIKDVPVVGMLKERRSLAIMVNTYIGKWLETHVNYRLHPELNVGGTATGRLSSSSEMFGNFQNIPRDTSRLVVNPKRILFPPRGMIWIDIDYSALEMRIAAWVAEHLVGRGKDTTLTRLIEDGEDMHLYTMRVSGIYDMLLRGRTPEQYLIDNGFDVAKLKGTPEEEFLKLARYKAKTTNFAAVYGAGERGIMKAVGCDKDEANGLVAGYHAAYPAVGKAMETMEKIALKPQPIPNDKSKTSQYVTYPIPALNLSRKYSYYPAVQRTARGGVWSPQKKAARGAFNSVVQGTGGLIMLASILRMEEGYGFAKPRLDIYDELEYTDVKGYDFSEGKILPLITVHDSVCFALRPDDLDIVPDICNRLCDWPTTPKLDVAVSAALIDESWGSVKEVTNMERWIETRGRDRG